MNAHTPGPWVVELPETGAVYASGRMVASVYGDDPDCKRDTRQDANCHLIAAAPDILDALKEAANELWSIPIASTRVLNKVRAAIAKAEGQS